MSQRIYVPFMLFNVRMVNMSHLWEPSFEYQGKKQDKPSYFTTCVTPKTRQNWWEEPLLAPCWAAYSDLLSKSGMTPQHVSEWPVKDGDMPSEPGKPPSEWAKGHWVLGGSTTNPIKVEMVQGGNVIPLVNKVGVKPGDFVALGLTAAIKQNNPRALKHYCNTVLFLGPGEEIAVGQSVSGAELMRTAQQQGLQVAGFSASPGFGGHPQGGFPGGGGAPSGPQYGGAPMGNPGFNPQAGGFPGNPQNGPGTAPMTAPHAATPGTVQNGTPQPGHGNVAFPSSSPFPS
jgi:hypothetical protein